MSIKVNVESHLTPDQVDYLQARGAWGQMMLNQNATWERLQEQREESDEDQESDDEDDMSDEDKRENLAKAQEWIAEATANQLRTRLAEWNLSTAGTKVDLQQRLTAAVEERYATSE